MRLVAHEPRDRLWVVRAEREGGPVACIVKGARTDALALARDQAMVYGAATCHPALRGSRLWAPVPGARPRPWGLIVGGALVLAGLALCAAT